MEKDSISIFDEFKNVTINFQKTKVSIYNLYHFLLDNIAFFYVLLQENDNLKSFISYEHLLSENHQQNFYLLSSYCVQNKKYFQFE